SVFVEASAHPVLTSGIEATAEDMGVRASALGTLRRDDGGLSRLLVSAGQLFVRGVGLDWAEFLSGTGRVDLPTYAFQHQRYWRPAAVDAGDVSGVGQTAVTHPLLGALIEPAAGGLLFTSRLSTSAQPWLADHAVRDTVLVPGAAFVEMAIRAGDEVGCSTLEELTLAEPLVLTSGVQVQVSLDEPGEAGSRAVRVHSRPADSDGPWTLHASGVLTPQTLRPAFDLGEWPPRGAVPVPMDDAYLRLAELGYGYGPLFQGLRAVWRQGDEVFAEVALPEPARLDADRFGLHPALLDAALHAVTLAGDDTGQVALPFSWNGVSLYAAGATDLRVRVSLTGRGGISLAVADSAGQPVLWVESLVSLPVDEERLNTVRQVSDALLRMTWTELPMPATDVDDGVVWAEWGELTDDRPVPEAVVLPIAPATDAEAVRAAVDETLAVLHTWLSDRRYADAKLVIRTSHAIALDDEQTADLAGAAVWGLVRSAQSEEPGRFVLVDTDGPIGTVLHAVVACGEPQVVVRGGVLRVGRLARAAVLPVPAQPWRLDIAEKGELGNLALVPAGGVVLAEGEVRIAVRAGGLNFRDVLNALGMYPGEAGPLGSEVAGVVVEVGPGVDGVAVGDRVLGMVPGGFAAEVVADARMIAPVPEGWSFAEAASVPVVFLTAFYGLVDLAGLRAGESVLVHAGAGGVGMAAIQLARYLGVEVFATAGPGKWEVLRSL
ncbi:polyketide synthase dehydratase domain-containing protein, partial [Kitasatospora sp. NPDC086801]|uniref:polyketide synthase dehydratase domain-containing protein n=1 Tax=Kitasatospora sp. NPDC086801 TaxID=3364066 RepID=UPI00380251A9